MKKRRRQTTFTTPRSDDVQAAGRKEVSNSSVPLKDVWKKVALLAALLLPILIWAYWPTLISLVETWNHEADYSHGFLVLPLAVYFLWARRDRFPGLQYDLRWAGIVLILLSFAMRICAGRFYLEALDGWSILLWVGGVIWLLAGWRVCRWSAPAVAFLWFMVPLPFSAERMLSLPLQGVATRISCWTLQALGQPALAEGHTILLGENQLDVAQACSGLRIFMGIVALAFAYTIVVRRAWWEKLVLLLSILPIALVANATRIVGTGLLYQYVSGEAAKRFTHDVAGWVMILFAAGLFAGVLWYLGRLIPEVELVEVGAVLRGKPDAVRRP